jgi:L-threonylcarbamoyladenylate synthase
MTQRLDRTEALRALASGEVVALPTDTVYGVAASLAHPTAISALFSLKRRPDTVALPVLVEGLDALASLQITLEDRARQLAQRFWPGPLTIIVAAPHELAQLVRSPRDAVGIRVPNDAALLALLHDSGPLAVTSANEHGAVPCTSAADVLATFEGRSELFGVLDDGPREGTVSSVVDLSGPELVLVRAGAFSEEELLNALS